MKSSWEQWLDVLLDEWVEEYLTVYGYPDEKRYPPTEINKMQEDFPDALSMGCSVIQRHFKSMKYSDFLKTPYWKCIASALKDRSPKCHLCGSSENLVVHHLTYTHHGRELDHLEDLVVVCKECHEGYFHKDTV
jgi:YgiT-type zinc finger domain-containing protein